jgi:hypothetical protein
MILLKQGIEIDIHTTGKTGHTSCVMKLKISYSPLTRLEVIVFKSFVK